MPLQSRGRPHPHASLQLMTLLFCGNDPITVIDMNVCYESQVASYYTGCLFLGSLISFFNIIFFSNNFIICDVRLTGLIVFRPYVISPFILRANICSFQRDGAVEQAVVKRSTK